MKTKSKKSSRSVAPKYKTAERVIRENEVIRSDRMQLIESATRVVGVMISKQIMPLIHCDYPVDGPALDATERQARDAALSFLARQFEQGYSLSETLERKVEMHYDRQRDSRSEF